MKTTLIPSSYGFSFQENQVQDRDNEEGGDGALHQPNGNFIVSASAAASLLARRDILFFKQNLNETEHYSTCLYYCIVKAKPESRETNILECVESEEIET